MGLHQLEERNCRNYWKGKNGPWNGVGIGGQVEKLKLPSFGYVLHSIFSQIL